MEVSVAEVQSGVGKVVSFLMLMKFSAEPDASRIEYFSRMKYQNQHERVVYCVSIDCSEPHPREINVRFVILNYLNIYLNYLLFYFKIDIGTPRGMNFFLQKFDEILLLGFEICEVIFDWRGMTYQYCKRKPLVRIVEVVSFPTFNYLISSSYASVSSSQISTSQHPLSLYPYSSSELPTSPQLSMSHNLLLFLTFTLRLLTTISTNFRCLNISHKKKLSKLLSGCRT